MHDRDHHAARPDPGSHRRKEVPLQIIAIADQIESVRLYDKLAALKICDSRIHVNLPLGGPIPQDLDGRWRSVHCDHSPAAPGKIDGIASSAASEVERCARF